MINEENGAEDTLVTGEHKSHRKRKASPIYTIIMAVLLCVAAFSGYKVLSTLIRNKQAKDTYNEIIKDVVVIVPDTEPETQPQPQAETTVQPTETTPAETTAESEVGTESVPESEVSTESIPETEPVDTTEESEEETGSEAVTEPASTEVVTEPASAAPPATQAAPTDPLYNLSVDFTRLRSINSDVVAWLQGMGNKLNYPVVQGRDNEYYLKHLIDGSYNGNGTLFVHCNNHFLQDDVTYIFGHHMYSGAMFGDLDYYDSSAYYWSHPEFKLYTPSKTYTLRVYSVFYGTGTERIVMNYGSEASFNKAMADFAARSMHTPQTSVSYGDKLVCLCTCAYQVTNGRYFILCKVMP